MDEPFRRDFDLLAAFTRDPDTNDRSLAIICTSYAEKYLGELIKARMKGLNHDLGVKLFKPDGVLGPLGARIDVAKALNIIEDPVFSDMKVLGSIRNKFAHNLEISTFDHPDIAKRIDKFQFKPELLRPVPPDNNFFLKSVEEWTREDRFRFTAMMICSTLHNGMNSLRFTLRHELR